MSNASKKAKTNTPHVKHRTRMRERYRKTGAEGFEFHEFIEMLLFYALPRVNTNKIAHEMADKFKNFAGLLEADENALKEISGISDNAALFFRILNDLIKFYNLDIMANGTNTKTREYYEKYLIEYYKTENREKILMLSLDSKMNVLSEDIIMEGYANVSRVDMHKIIKCAMIYNAAAVILAHNHPNGAAYPSPEDLETTKRILHLLTEVNINLIDHYIVAGDSIASIRDKAIIRKDNNI